MKKQTQPSDGSARAGSRSVRGKNPGRSRAHNRRVVLDLLRSQGQLGRRDLADRTQLSLQAITKIVEDLMQDGLLVARDRRRGSRGQPPLQYALDPAGAFTIGIELAVTRMVITVVDLGGAVRFQEIRTLGSLDPALLIPLMAAEVTALRGLHPGKLIGVGLVMPSPFEFDGLSVNGPTTLTGWAGIDVAADLSARLGIPVELENDANAAAIGETLLGVGRTLGDFAVIYFGTGLGLGIVADDTLVRGAFGNAGEIGHIVVVPGGRPCTCGQSGCLERYASPHSLREWLDACGVPSGFDDLARLMTERDVALLDWICEAASHLSPVVAMLENILDPQTIVFSGNLPDTLLDALIAGLTLAPSVSHHDQRSVARVIRGHAGQITASLGAAALPLHTAITPRLDLADAAPIPILPDGATP